MGSCRARSVYLTTQAGSLLSALDKILSNWVFWTIFTHTFLIESGIWIFLLGYFVIECKKYWYLGIYSISLIQIAFLGILIG